MKSDPVDLNDPPRTWPGGQLEPNDFALFDVWAHLGGLLGGAGYEVERQVRVERRRQPGHDF